VKRRIIKLGGSTLVISLPTKWAKEQQLAPGQEVAVDPDGTTLHLHVAEPKKEERIAHLFFSRDDWRGERPEKYIQRLLATAYKQGADTITVEAENPKILDYIERRVDGFIGIEIVGQQRGQIMIKSLVEGLETEFANVLQRTILLTAQVVQETPHALGDAEASENLLRLERTHNKITDFAKRLLARRSSHTREEKYLYCFIAEDERLVDEYKYLLKEMKGKQLSRAFTEALAEVTAFVEQLLRLIRKEDLAAAKELSQRSVILRQELKRLFEKEGVGALHLYNIVVKAYEMGETLLEWKH
jgi:phosphate uptake regulator